MDFCLIGSYDQSPHLCDVYSNWTESSVAKQPHLTDDLEEDKLKETLADAMVESPIKDAGKGMVKQGNYKHLTYVEKNKIFEHKIVTIFLSINLNMCFGCSKEPSH